mgnify:CR=1 FL=1
MKMQPENGSSASLCLQMAAKRSIPIRPSTVSVATRILICGVIWNNLQAQLSNQRCQTAWRALRQFQPSLSPSWPCQMDDAALDRGRRGRKQFKKVLLWRRFDEVGPNDAALQTPVVEFERASDKPSAVLLSQLNGSLPNTLGDPLGRLVFRAPVTQFVPEMENFWI